MWFRITLQKVATDFHTFSEGAFSCTRAVSKSLAKAFDKALIFFFFIKAKRKRDAECIVKVKAKQA